MVSLSFRGLAIEGRADYDPGVRYYPDGSGDPPSWEIEIESIEMDDWEEFSSHALLADEGISEGVERMLGVWHGWSKGRILARVEALILRKWEDDILDALAEASED